MVNLTSLETEVTVDVASVLHGPDVICWWFRAIKPATGELVQEVWARDLANERKPGLMPRKRARRVTVEGNKLVCNCESFYYSKPGQKTCKHLVAVGLWLNKQALRDNLNATERAFCELSHNDPHRLAVTVAELVPHEGKKLSLIDLFEF